MPAVPNSLAALSSISNPFLHPLTKRIHILLTTFTSNHVPITFIWVPGHTGIPGKENVDKAAKKVLILPIGPSSYLPTNSDLLSPDGLHSGKINLTARKFSSSLEFIKPTLPIPADYFISLTRNGKEGARPRINASS